MTDVRTGTDRVALDIGGMTCASCAARVEKKLNRLDGVEATVNYATEVASVEFDPAIVSVGELVATVEATGYTATPPSPPTPADAMPDGSAAAKPPHDDRLDAARNRLLVSALLGLPVVALSMIPALQFRNWQWLALCLAAPVAVWGAWPFHRAAALNARHRATTMDTLISIGVIAAFGWSLWALFLGDAGMAGMKMSMSLAISRSAAEGASHHIYLEVACGVTVFVLAGRYFEARSKYQAGDALRALAEVGAKEVAVLDNGLERRIPASELVPGMTFVVRPGERVATDGTVTDGSSAVDNSLITGESVPLEVGVGDEVIGGAVNAGGRIVVRADRVGVETALAQIGALIADAQSGKAPIQRLADRVASVFVPAVIALSLVTLAFWWWHGDGGVTAFSAAVAVLIIACPCALGLATPTALLVGTGRGAQLGVVISGPEVLERTKAVDTIVLDKTGTVTTGEMRLVEVVAAGGVERTEMLRLMGSLEAASEHPVARAIVEGAVAASNGDGVVLADVHDFESHAGLGVTGTVDGRQVVVGRPAFARERGIVLGDELTTRLGAAEAAGSTVVVGGADGEPLGLLVVADEARPSSADAIGQLVGLGLQPVLLTGDNDSAARRVAAAVGIDDVIAGVLPSGKVDEVRRLQSEGRVVAMVGDGINDAAALAQADLGIAMGTGSDVAIAASDLTLVRADLVAAVDAIRLSRATLRTIRVNLFWAFAYNVAALPVAAAGLLNPVIAGATMALSSVLVVSNSLRLRRFA